MSSEDLAGEYTLTDFLWTFDDGTVVSSDDYPVYSGYMILTAGGDIGYSVTLNGETSVMLGTYTVETTGSLRIDESACSYSLGIGYNGDSITLTQDHIVCGTKTYNYTSVHTWTRN